jgi:hypothetical protein
VRRVQTLSFMGDLDPPYRAVVADQVESALDLIVHQARLPDGARRVVEVAPVEAGPDGPRLTTLVRWGSHEGFEHCPLRGVARREAESGAVLAPPHTPRGPRETISAVLTEEQVAERRNEFGGLGAHSD